MNRFQLDNLVCEVRALPRVPTYRWYEVDLDRRFVANRSPLPAHVIGATRSSDAAEVCRLLVDDAAVTHVQYEAPDVVADADRQAAAVRAAGREPIPAAHLPHPPASFRELRDRALRLAECKPQIVKLVYPCATRHQLDIGLRLLDRWPGDAPGLSLTPAGGPQARLAAALAGSRLVYAPRRPTGERMSVSWYRQLLAGGGPDSGVQTWMTNG